MARARVRGIYPIRENLKAQRESIEKSEELDPAAKTAICDFLDKCAANGLSTHRTAFYAVYFYSHKSLPQSVNWIPLDWP